MFVDNVRFDKASGSETDEDDGETPTKPGTDEDDGETPTKPDTGKDDGETPAKPGIDDDNTPADPVGGNDGSEDLKPKPVKNSDKAGEKLPNTATNSFNTLLFGGIVLLLGAGTYFYVRRKYNLEQE
ncbi:LPXTG cell wall anchor domain-containing protein [Bacillus sp. J37]|uniref:LPXTG cell wall anchor domain-containing protein n=1 Tax=Bacillus sp. J37 TaxID=935837 RepID=UPI001E3EE17C|nr:LPXTG cell wall anchor domain-containing protein [Bacillus sp. J37]